MSDSIIHNSTLGSNTEAWNAMALGFSESILMMMAPGRQMENGKASREGAGGSGRKPEMELWGICVSSVAERACW